MDSKVYTQWVNTLEFQTMMRPSAPTPWSSDKAKESFSARLKDAEDSGFPFFAICLKPDEAELPASLDPGADLFVKDGRSRHPMIGLLSLRKAGTYSTGNRNATFGIAFDEKHGGKGYGTELLRWACDYVFDTLGMHRFELEVYADNAKALKMYERVGFKFEGRQREVVFRNGKFQDVILMALLKHEWRSRRQETG